MYKINITGIDINYLWLDPITSPRGSRVSSEVSENNYSSSSDIIKIGIHACKVHTKRGSNKRKSRINGSRNINELLQSGAAKYKIESETRK